MIEFLISSSALILVIVALRCLPGNRISARLRYALWLLVLVRLLVPVSFFHSGVTVAGAAAPVTERVVTLSERPLSSPAVTPAEVAPAAAPAPAPDVPAAPARTLGDLARTLWLTGIGIMGAWFLFVNVRMVRLLRKSRRPYSTEGKPRVYVAEGLPSPCLFGLFRPGIYLTERSAEDPDRARRIIAHEQTHYRHGDMVWALLRSMCLAVWWFDPLVWLAAVLSRRDGELSCDEGTICALGEAERLEYGRTLVDMARVGVRPSDLLCGAITMTSGKSALRQRVERIARAPKTSAAAAVLSLLVAAGAAGCTFGGAAREADTSLPTGADVFRRYYTQQAETDQRLDYSRMDLDALNDMAVPTAQPVIDTEEFTIETAGAIVSGNMAEIVLRVTAKELDTLLREEADPGPLQNYRFGDENAMMSIFTLNRSFCYLAHRYTYCDTNEALAPNQLEIRYWIVLPESFAAHPYTVPYWIEPVDPGDGELFYIPLENFGYYNWGLLVPLYTGTWNVGIDLTPAADTGKTLPVERELRFGEETLLLQSIQVTPLGCTVRLVCPEGEDYINEHWDALIAAHQEANREARETGFITFSDGTHWTINKLYDISGGGSAADYGLCLLFPGPLDMEKIAALSLFGWEFDLR